MAGEITKYHHRQRSFNSRAATASNAGSKTTVPLQDITGESTQASAAMWTICVDTSDVVRL